jgi:hypothetical protein
MGMKKAAVMRRPATLLSEKTTCRKRDDGMHAHALLRERKRRGFTWLMLRNVASSSLRGREHLRIRLRNCGRKTNRREAKEGLRCGWEANAIKQQMRIRR